MSGKRGQKHYDEVIKQAIREEYAAGKSVQELHRKHGISRYAIQSWCGLRPEVNTRQSQPKQRGRPRQRPESLEEQVKRLQMENELLRDFLQRCGRR